MYTTLATFVDDLTDYVVLVDGEDAPFGTGEPPTLVIDDYVP